jgi:hypothetical protein
VKKLRKIFVEKILENFLCEKLRKKFGKYFEEIFVGKTCEKILHKILERNKIQKKNRKMKKIVEELTWAHRSPRPAIALGTCAAGPAAGPPAEELAGTSAHGAGPPAVELARSGAPAAGPTAGELAHGHACCSSVSPLLSAVCR